MSSLSPVTPDSVVSAFEDLGFDLDDPKVIDRLTSLCDIYAMDADKMSAEVMAFMFKKKQGGGPTNKILEEFEGEVLVEEEQKKKKKKSGGRKTIVDVTNLMMDDDDDDDDTLKSYNVVKTPKRSKEDNIGGGAAAAKKRMGAAIPFSPGSYVGEEEYNNTTPNSRKYQSRKNAGSTVITFGEGSDSWKKTAASDRSVAVKPFAGTRSPLEEPYRFMFDGLRDKAGFLDESICRVGEALAAKHDDLDEPHDFAQTLPDPFVCLGRVCCDASDGRLNPHSVLLQGSQDVCRGKTLPLDPSRVGEYSLFPGQIVLAQAVNPNGTRILASKIHSDTLPLPFPPPTQQQKQVSLSVVMASGPYTTSDNVLYEPLADFLKYVLAHRPHLVILCGPFVDERHQMVSSGELQSETFEQLRLRVMGTIYGAAKEAAATTEFVVVSSSMDVDHLPVYPTPPFPAPTTKEAVFQDTNNVHLVSDPCMLSVDGVVFGLTSTDVLFHLGREEISFPPKSGDRLRRLANHVLHQRSFYPLYPPSEEVNLDVEKLECHAQLEVRPHVLVLPSDLLHFFKDIDGGMVVNPSRLAKREGGGVFARFVVRPVKDSGEDEPFSKRVYGEIVRI